MGPDLFPHGLKRLLLFENDPPDLDELLVSRGLAESRSQAQRLILAGPVAATNELQSLLPTPLRRLLRAAEIGREEGLRFVYAGNLPGAVRRWENTYCPGCDTLLIERTGFRVLRNVLGGDGCCPSCRRKIPGVWTA